MLKRHSSTLGHDKMQPTIAALISECSEMNADVGRFVKSCPVRQNFVLFNALATASTRTAVVWDLSFVVSVARVGSLPADWRLVS